jgi:uncharacterized protein
MTDQPSAREIELQAAAYRRLVAHLGTRSDVQNIALMNLAGFCRNCLANWYQEADNATGGTLTKEQSRVLVYGMAYKDWQALHQREATASEKTAFEQAKPLGH